MMETWAITLLCSKDRSFKVYGGMKGNLGIQENQGTTEKWPSPDIAMLITKAVNNSIDTYKQLVNPDLLRLTPSCVCFIPFPSKIAQRYWDW